MHSLTLAHELVRVLADPYNPGSGKPPPHQMTEKIERLLDWSAWTVSAVCVGGVFGVAARMAMNHRRGEGAEHAAGLGWLAVACIMIGSASALVGALI